MAKPTTRLEGVAELEKAVAAKLSEYQAEIEQAVAKSADDIANDWRRSVPVDDGDYRDSIGVDHHGLTADVANFGRKGRHGRHVEFGTSKMRPRPAAGPAAERGRKTLVDNVTEALK